jgi:CRP-like cAMP-binding protein
MKKKMKQLDPSQIKKLSENYKEIVFNNDFDFVYEEQIPNSALILIDGEILLSRKNKIIEKIHPGSLLGAYQLLHDEPVKFACKINRKSKAILLNKTALLECLRDRTSPLFEIIQQLQIEN